MYEYIVVNNIIILSIYTIIFSRFEVDFQGYIFLDTIITERPST